MYNKYIEAGRYDNLPASECKSVANALAGLIATSTDAEYVDDARMRLTALEYRILKG